MTGVINRCLKPSKIQKHSRLKIYIKFTLPTVLNGYETWAVREQDKYRITGAKDKFMRRNPK